MATIMLMASVAAASFFRIRFPLVGTPRGAKAESTTRATNLSIAIAAMAIAVMAIDQWFAFRHDDLMGRRDTAELNKALKGIDEATRENVQRSNAIQRRVEWMQERLAEGVTPSELIREEPRPAMVEMITMNIEALQILGSRLRQAEARALRADGVTMEEIAQLFGVTRQRISALLKQGEDS